MMQVELKQIDGSVIMVGHPADVREKVELLFQEKYGFCPDMQESDIEEDEEYLIYVHSEGYDELEEDEIEALDNLGITEDPEETTENLKTLLQIDFTIK